MPTQLPSIFELIRSSITLYRTNASAIIATIAVQLVLSTTLSAAVAFGVSEAASEADMPIVISMALVSVVLFLGTLFTSLMLLHTIRGASERIAFLEAFARARKQFMPFIVLNALSVLIVAGVLGLLALPLVSIYFKGFEAQSLLPIGVGLAVIGAFALCVLWASFIFANFVLLDGLHSGVSALVASRELLRGNFWAVVLRVLGVGVLLGIGIAIVSGIVGSVAGIPGNTIVREIAAQAVSALGAPLIISAMYVLYTAVKRDVPTSTSLRSWLAAFAVVGTLTIIAVIAAGVYLFPVFVNVFQQQS
jgi:hypothetical protein